MEHWQREGVKDAPSASVDNKFYELTDLTTLSKETVTITLSTAHSLASAEKCIILFELNLNATFQLQVHP